jgi:uncharacterized membrane protein YkoI
MERIVRLALTLLVLALPGTAAAREADLQDERIVLAQSGDFVPLEDILASLRDQYSGHQLSVSGPAPEGEGYVYRIKWLTDDGAVLYVVADAETGDILSVEGE